MSDETSAARDGDPGSGYGGGWGGGSNGAPSNSGGKPGESSMAENEAQSPRGMSNEQRQDAGMGSWEGFNPNNPTQTVDQMRNAERLDSFLGRAAPIAAGMISPAFGTAMTLGKAGANMANGMDPAEALAGYGGGLINGVVNRATGGLYGMAGLASKVSGALGGPTMPNIGGTVMAGLVGSRTGTPASAPVSDTSTATASHDRGDSNMPVIGALTNPVAPAVQTAGVNANLFGSLDSHGWSSAAKKYAQSA